MQYFPSADDAEYDRVKIRLEDGWVHVAAVYDGSNITIYLNGNDRFSKPYTTDTIRGGGSHFHIGATHDTETLDAYFKGWIAQVSLWSVAREPQQIKDSQDEPLDGNTPGLLGYWPMDEGDGNKIIDVVHPEAAIGSINGGAAWEDSDIPFDAAMGQPRKNRRPNLPATTPLDSPTGTNGGGNGLTRPGGNGVSGPRGRGVTSAVWTTTALAAATQHLNRRSMTGVLQQVVNEVDDHCTQLVELKGEDISIRNEIQTQVTSIRNLINQLENKDIEHDKEISELDRLIKELGNNLSSFKSTINVDILNILNKQWTINEPEIIKKIKNELSVLIKKDVTTIIQEGDGADLTEIENKLKNLRQMIDDLKRSIGELTGSEIEKIKEIFKQAINNIDLGDIIGDVIDKATVNIQGSSFSLVELLNILAGSDRVANVEILYDRDDISGAYYMLADEENTVVIFRCEPSYPSENEVVYTFETDSWKNVPASFQLHFSKSAYNMRMCGKSLSLESYDVVSQSNLVFDLFAGDEREFREFQGLS